MPLLHTDDAIERLFSCVTNDAIPLTGYTVGAWGDAPDTVKNQFGCENFTGQGGQVALLGGSGQLAQVLVGLGKGDDVFAYGIADKLPTGVYAIDGDMDAPAATQAMIAWGLSAYGFDGYKSQKSKKSVQLVVPAGADKNLAMAQIAGTYLGRDLINTPANDLSPKDLTEVAQDLAQQFDATLDSIAIDTCPDAFPMIYAVGKGCKRRPYLIDLRWGDPQGKAITLVGKGVVFDTGGYNLKPTPGMALMKKDMGGAAVALAVARMIMRANLSGVNLRVLIPTVENSVSGNAYRPGDVLQSRRGTTVEIGNTDAEGRLILGDALTYACEGDTKPHLVIDFATLTGAARVALGTELPALFTENQDIANAIMAIGTTVGDPVWHMPLHHEYRHIINSDIADINNSGAGGYGGAITAGLFLHEFMERGIPWVHFDLMGYNLRHRAGRPKGGEPNTARAVFAYIQEFCN